MNPIVKEGGEVLVAAIIEELAKACGRKIQEISDEGVEVVMKRNSDQIQQWINDHQDSVLAELQAEHRHRRWKKAEQGRRRRTQERLEWESDLDIGADEPGGLFDMVKDVYRETELRPWDYWHPGLGLIKLGRMALKDR